jgi:hypothetical protein
MTRVKHHGLAHLFLIIVLFVIGSYVFGGWTEGPMTSALFLGLKTYGMFRVAQSGSIVPANELAQSTLSLVIAFVINLIIFYIVAAVLIFLFNLCFGGKAEGHKK